LSGYAGDVRLITSRTTFLKPSYSLQLRWRQNAHAALTLFGRGLSAYSAKSSII
jgi:hypothetical protein